MVLRLSGFQDIRCFWSRLVGFGLPVSSDCRLNLREMLLATLAFCVVIEMFLGAPPVYLIVTILKKDSCKFNFQWLQFLGKCLPFTWIT